MSELQYLFIALLSAGFGIGIIAGMEIKRKHFKEIYNDLWKKIQEERNDNIRLEIQKRDLLNELSKTN